MIIGPGPNHWPRLKKTVSQAGSDSVEIAGPRFRISFKPENVVVKAAVEQANRKGSLKIRQSRLSTCAWCRSINPPPFNRQYVLSVTQNRGSCSISSALSFSLALKMKE